jgi:hypothetical protein
MCSVVCIANGKIIIMDEKSELLEGESASVNE